MAFFLAPSVACLKLVIETGYELLSMILVWHQTDSVGLLARHVMLVR